MKIQNKINKLLSFFVVLFSIFVCFAKVEVSANIKIGESIVFCDAKLEDDFYEDTIIIVLKNSVSLTSKTYDVSDFPEINCIFVEDLTENTLQIVEKQILAMETGDWSLLNKHIENDMLIDLENFHRILCLTIGNAGKENVLEAIKLLEKRNDIISAEPDYIEKLELSTDDPLYAGVNNIGQWGLKGEYGTNADKAWNFTTGNSSIIVGVIDSGIDGKHPDLINAINDDLHRDYVDTPLFSSVREVDKADLEDLSGHGTHVAGVIGAQANNGIGVSGIVWDVRLVSLRVFNKNGIGKTSNVKRAIDFATEEAIPILNYSGGSTNPDNGVKKAIENYPGLFVCAAGNEDEDNDLIGHYPSNHRFSNLISVGAINPTGVKRPNSNYGATTVDIFAPGSAIISTYPIDLYDAANVNHIAKGYKVLGGTSMATPYVTGVAALMLSINPNLTPQQIKFTILNNATKYSNLEEICVSGGTLDAFKAVSAIAFSTSTVNGGISIDGFIDGYSVPNQTNLEIPSSFAQVSTSYGTPLQNVCMIGDSAFKGNENLKSIIMPNTVIGINSNAFENCSHLQSITLPNNLTSIGNASFKGCSSLSSITIPNSVMSIEPNVFENCSHLQSITLPNNLTSIGNASFKGCSSLSSITIPNSVMSIEPNVFENCSHLQSITLPNNLTSIGNASFKGCSSLTSITIPNGVTNIDPNAFENCLCLQTVILPTTLYTIGTSAFKGCSSLFSITLPNSVEFVENEAFKNCSSLAFVHVERAIFDITNLGLNVFSGCSNALQIIVPTNRVAEYKNKPYWSSYKAKIMPSGEYITFEIDCESSLDESVQLNSGYNQLYQLNVNCGKTYRINTNASTGVTLKVYNADMDYVAGGDNILDSYLGVGTYYISIEFSSHIATGLIDTHFGLRWPSSDVQLNDSVNNNIKTYVHATIDNISHGKFYYWNERGPGFFQFKLSGVTNVSYLKGAITIYDDQNRTMVLDRYTIANSHYPAISNEGESEMYVYLPEKGNYYIDIVLPTNGYTTLNFRIEEVEKNDINYLNRMDSVGFDELFFNQTTQSYFEEVTISHRSKIEYDIQTSKTINENIPVYILEKQNDSGNYIVPKLIEEITKTNRSPIFTIILEPGTYYIGYSGNFEEVGIHVGLRRKVNVDMNLSGVLVTDPAYQQQFNLGTEVIFNNGELRGSTITEGFTRNLYLMVEDRFHDPMSRLEYDWYSSNENVAKVSEYGTVLGLKVSEDTEVTIYAINKIDPTIVYKTKLKVIKETSIEELNVECNMSYSYSKKNGIYQLELDFTNSPYPYIQYYDWEIIGENSIDVSMSNWGVITSSGIGEITIIGKYRLNSRVKLMIHLTITE